MEYLPNEYQKLNDTITKLKSVDLSNNIDLFNSEVANIDILFKRILDFFSKNKIR